MPKLDLPCKALAITKNVVTVEFMKELWGFSFDYPAIEASVNYLSIRLELKDTDKVIYCTLKAPVFMQSYSVSVIETETVCSSDSQNI